MALSGYLPFADETIKHVSVANRQLPIFIAHGTDDPIVNIALGQAAHAALQQAGYPVSWHSYPMQHAVSEQEIADISRWLQETCRKN